jgi:NAD(P)H-hydrate epimerase
MIKILSAEQIRALDAFTIEREPVLSIDLMERACEAFTTWFTQYFKTTNKIGIVCGTGNNGGDGLGIARLLHLWGYPVQVWIIPGKSQSADFLQNLSRLKDLHIVVTELTAIQAANPFEHTDILIDAIFGTGLSRPVEGVYAEVIKCINESEALRIAVDVPSGLLMDQPTAYAVKAHYTVSFQVPKLVFLLPACAQYVGEWTLVDIGLRKDFIRETSVREWYVTAEAVSKILRTRTRFDHKGTFGHAVLVAGSLGKIGAAVMSARAALRSGPGLLTAHIPRCGYSILQTAVPEAMISIDRDEDKFTTLPLLDAIQTVGIGPGLGQDDHTIRALRQLLESFDKPMVLDADALNILSKHRELMHVVPQGSILTPHPKEFERLVGVWSSDFEKLDKQKALAASLKSVVIVKGAFTSIATPDGNVYFNSTGNPGMAKGGSGDVLTGILTGLLAQRYSPQEAAILGVYLHGMAGDMGAREKGKEALLASDIIESLPQAFVHLNRLKQKKLEED